MRDNLNGLIHAADMMSTKGYEEGRLDHPQFIESQKRYQELFDKLAADRTAWENWKPIRDIQ